MSLEGPRFPTPESGKDDTDKDGKPTKKSYRFLPNPKAEQSGQPTNAEIPQRPASLEEIIAASRKRKAEAATDVKEAVNNKTDHDTEIESAETDTTEQIADGPETPGADETEVIPDQTEVAASDPAGTRAETDATEEADDERQLPHWRELQPNEFSGGEVVRLRGVEALEGEVPLHVTAESEPTAQPREQHEYQVFTPQQEQQHQSAATTERAPDITGSGGSEKPPAEPPEAALTPSGPDRPVLTPAVEVIDPTQRTSAANETGVITGSPEVSTADRPATKQEVEDAMYYSARANAQHGVISGLFAGVYFANRRIRRKQKQETKLLKQQAKQLERQQGQINALQQNQKPTSSPTERQFASLDTRLNRAPRSETVSSQVENRSKQSTPNQSAPSERPLQVPQGHHLETSAWHTIEVDDKTGKPVEKPSFEYGREYQREHAHENMPVDQQTVPTASGAASGGSGQTGDNLATSNGAINQSQAPTPGSSARNTSASRSSKIKEAFSRGPSTAGPLWPWVVALIVALFCLVLVIR